MRDEKKAEPIKDDVILEKLCMELKSIDEKYLIMFLVGIGTGLQLQEILRLRVRDVRHREYFDSSIGMRDVRREFRIPEDLREKIDEFTENRDLNDYLVYGHNTRKDTPISRQQAYRVLKVAGEKVGIGAISAQTMRKTFAYRYYRRTGDIFYLQDLLNHASVTLTYRYIGMTPPNPSVGISKKTSSENVKARERLFHEGSGIRHIEKIKEQLTKIEEGIESPKNPDAWYGKTESLLSSIDLLLEEYRKI